MGYEDKFMAYVWEQQKKAMAAHDKWEHELDTILNDVFPQSEATDQKKGEPVYAVGA